MRGKRRADIGGVRQWLAAHKKQLVVGVPAGLLVLIVLVQLFYPGNRLLPLQKIDESSYGLNEKSEAVKALDATYKRTSLQLYFGDAAKPQFTPKLGEFGLTASNSKRIDELKYPWYMRLVPTSILWAHLIYPPTPPDYTRDEKRLDKYLATELDGSCSVAPQNATAKVADGTIVVVPEVDGGVCKESDVRSALMGLKVTLPAEARARVAMDPRPAPLRAPDVRPIVETINTQIGNKITLSHDTISLDVAQKELHKWLAFSTEGDKLSVSLATEQSDKYLRDNLDDKLTRPAGTTKVTTRDFVEVSREDGASGQRLDTDVTRAHIIEYLLARSETITIAAASVDPRVEYTRNYSNSDTGLSALMKHYAETNPGTYGVSLIELDGKRRRASFEDTRKFTTASTYKLYVAFSALKRIESGEYKWSDQIVGGRNLEQCFEDMIAKSDNPCAEALVAKIGYRPITQDAHTVVSPSTTFLDTESYKTTAGDLSTFMASLATRQIPLRAESIERLTESLKRNVYRQGIPAGANGQVANKVGFLDGFLHDAAIVYSPSGTYALSIMTDGSSWANIAKLTRDIEKLRGQ